MSAEETVAQWNAQAPAGTRVRVRLDDGSWANGVTLGPAWATADGRAVVRVGGINGELDLKRVEVRP